MNVSINSEQAFLNITGSFDGVNPHSMQVTVRFPLSNQDQFICTIQTIQNNR